MNVLAAPFLYTLPSELEAFYCFSKFIEVCCPLYVQPTLEGVHRGLKVRSNPLPQPTKLTILPPPGTPSSPLSHPRDTAPRPLPKAPRPRPLRVPPLQEPLRRDLRLPLHPHPLRLHPATRSGSPAVGLSPRVRRAPQRALRHRAAAAHAR